MHASFSAVSLSLIFIWHLPATLHRLDWVQPHNGNLPSLEKRETEKKKRRRKEKENKYILRSTTIVCDCDRVATQSPAIPGHPSRKPAAPEFSSPLASPQSPALRSTQQTLSLLSFLSTDASPWGLCHAVVALPLFIYLSSGSRLGNIKPHPSISSPLVVDTRLLLVHTYYCYHYYNYTSTATTTTTFRQVDRYKYLYLRSKGMDQESVHGILHALTSIEPHATSPASLL